VSIYSYWNIFAEMPVSHLSRIRMIATVDLEHWIKLICHYTD